MEFTKVYEQIEDFQQSQLEALMTAPLASAAFQLQPFPQIHLLLAGCQVGGSPGISVFFSDYTKKWTKNNMVHAKTASKMGIMELLEAETEEMLLI